MSHNWCAGKMIWHVMTFTWAMNSIEYCIVISERLCDSYPLQPIRVSRNILETNLYCMKMESHIGSLWTLVWAPDQEVASTCAILYLVASFDFAGSRVTTRATSKAATSLRTLISTEGWPKWIFKQCLIWCLIWQKKQPNRKGDKVRCVDLSRTRKPLCEIHATLPSTHLACLHSPS